MTATAAPAEVGATGEAPTALRRGAAAACLLLLAGVQAALLGNLFHRGEPVGQDLAIHLGEIAQLARALRAGDLGLWNPGANLGYPSGYYYQVLPQLLAAVPHAALGSAVPLLLLFKLAVAAPLVLLPVATWRAARAAGAGSAEALGAAAGIGFATARAQWGLGLDSVFLSGLYTQAWAMLFYPMALARAWRFLRHGERPAAAVGWALLTGLCHPFVAAMIPVALLASPWWRAGLGPAARRGAALLALVLAASAFFWAPILVHYDSFGGFPARLPGEEGPGPARLLRLLASGDLLDAGRFPVLTALLLAAAALARRGGLAPALLAQGAPFAALLALGPFLRRGPDDLFPAVRALAPMQAAWAGAAGAAAGAALSGAWARVAAWPAARRRAARALAAAAALAALGAAAEGSWRRAERIVFTAADRPAAGRGDLAEVMEALAARPPGRVLAVEAGGVYDYWARYLPFVYSGKPAVYALGGAPLQSSANYAYLREVTGAHQALYDIRYLILGASQFGTIDPTRQALLRLTARYAAVEMASPGIIGPIRVAGAVGGDRIARRGPVAAWLAGPGPAAGEHLAIGEPAGAGAPPAGRVLSQWEAPSRYGAEVEVAGERPTTFVARITWHPGWSAAVDGVPAAVRRVTPDFPAVDVPPGRHAVALRFRRPWWTWALLAGGLGIPVGLRWGQRRRAGRGALPGPELRT